MPAANRKVALTDRSLLALKPTGERAIVWDALLPGLAVRVSAKGKRSFYAVRRRAGATQPSWVLVGAYPETSLAEARSKAREALAALTEGHDPARLSAAKRRAEERAQANLFGNVAEEFIKRHAMTRRTGRIMAMIVRRELVPVWGDRQIGEISRRAVIELIESIVDRGGDGAGPGHRRTSGGPYSARHTLTIARKLFNWAVGRDILEHSPCDRVRAAEILGSPQLARDRVLSDAEIRAVWETAGEMGYPYGVIIRLLLLTGQRRSEIAELRWSEINLERASLTIPTERMKMDAAHVVPLGPKAIEILDGLPRFDGVDLVFVGRSGVDAVTGFSTAAEQLNCKTGNAPHTLHDIRRSVRTRLAELGVTPFIGELVIGHRQSGVHAVYDLHRYEAEKREALLKWQKALLAIVGEPEPTLPENVVAMSARARA